MDPRRRRSARALGRNHHSAHTTHPAECAGARASRAPWRATANPRPRHRPECWCRREARTSALPWPGRGRPGPRYRRQAPPLRNTGSGRKLRGSFLGAEQVAQRGLHQLGHGSPLSRRLALELGHDRVVDIERRLHMANHIRTGWQYVNARRELAAGPFEKRGKRRRPNPAINRSPPRGGSSTSARRTA